MDFFQINFLSSNRRVNACALECRRCSIAVSRCVPMTWSIRTVFIKRALFYLDTLLISRQNSLQRQRNHQQHPQQYQAIMMQKQEVHSETIVLATSKVQLTPSHGLRIDQCKGIRRCKKEARPRRYTSAPLQLSIPKTRSSRSTRVPRCEIGIDVRVLDCVWSPLPCDWTYKNWSTPVRYLLSFLYLRTSSHRSTTLATRTCVSTSR